MSTVIDHDVQYGTQVFNVRLGEWIDVNGEGSRWNSRTMPKRVVAAMAEEGIEARVIRYETIVTVEIA